MIDRLVHYRHLLLFDGKSYRMKHALMRQPAARPTRRCMQRYSSSLSDHPKQDAFPAQGTDAVFPGPGPNVPDHPKVGLVNHQLF